MTGGEIGPSVIIVDDDYEGDDFTFTVDRLFTKTGTVGADDGSGLSMVTVDVLTADTEHAHEPRRAYRYSLSVDHDGDILTLQRGLFVVVPELDAVT